MALNAETPDPPELTNRGMPPELEPDDTYDTDSDFRREELQVFLHDGAWKEAFKEWAEYSDLSDEEYRQVLDLGLVEQLDFFWDPVQERLRSTVPAMPDEWPGRADISSKVRTELSDLGDAVTEMLEDGYVDWGTRGQSKENWSELKYSEELEFSGETEEFKG